MDPGSERRIASLDASIRPAARRLLELASDAGIRLGVVSGLRSYADQDRLFCRGRVDDPFCVARGLGEPGARVTPLRGGESWHQFGLAFDVAPLDDRDLPYWPATAEPWATVGQLGEGLGLLWGGRFPAPDLGHFERRGGLSLASVQRGARPAVPSPPGGPSTGARVAGAIGVGLLVGAVVGGIFVAVRRYN